VTRGVGGPHATFSTAITVGGMDHGAIGVRRKGLETQINPGLLARRFHEREEHSTAGEADVPAIRFPTDRDRLGPALKRARPPYRHTASRGEHQEAVFEACAIVIVRRGETVEPVPSVNAGGAGSLPQRHPPEEGVKRTLNAQGRILHHLAMDFGVFRHRLLDSQHLRFLLVGAD
jgi:hypothetical protein